MLGLGRLSLGPDHGTQQYLRHAWQRGGQPRLGGSHARERPVIPRDAAQRRVRHHGDPGEGERRHAGPGGRGGQHVGGHQGRELDGRRQGLQAGATGTDGRQLGEGEGVWWSVSGGNCREGRHYGRH